MIKPSDFRDCIIISLYYWFKKNQEHEKVSKEEHEKAPTDAVQSHDAHNLSDQLHNDTENLGLLSLLVCDLYLL